MPRKTPQIEQADISSPYTLIQEGLRGWSHIPGLRSSQYAHSQVQSRFKSRKVLRWLTRMAELPAFDDLPLRKAGTPGNAWGLFGDGDECGMLNLLTPDAITAATKEIRDGVRIPTDLPLDFISKPLFGRAAFQHTIKNKAPRQVNDDTLHFNTQVSTQWDGFRHYAHQASNKYFNGHTLDELLETKVNGIHGETFTPQMSGAY